ncbi:MULTISPECIES: lactococcin 972 family bacteriocin [Bacillus cereus group]|uniref:lactococcin 972 family bacteriocin n=1 Tax=Bacillus cereus group TaxID=86661 RepID=UPI0005CF3FFE|nr:MULTISPECIES: lactococcin 972 family bacteriocin [Bacillus cereus group]TBL05098.1 lactococcin 972 family bacteriocin [Bacillus paranthracis]
MKRTKKIVSVLSLTAMLSMGGLSAYASGDEGPQSGEVNYDLHPTNQVLEWAGGGWWEHWIDGIYSNYSKYEHNNRTHSTYVGTLIGSKSSGWVRPGAPAEASIKPTPTGNTAKWNTQ